MKLSKIYEIFSIPFNTKNGAFLLSSILMLLFVFSCYKKSPENDNSGASIIAVDKRLKMTDDNGYYCSMCDAEFIRGRCVGDDNYRECQPGSGKDCPFIKSRDVVTNALAIGEITDPGFQPVHLSDGLYNFRDSYLRQSSKGIAYMNTFYYLSDVLFDNNTVYSVSNALYLLNTINNYVLPNTLELMSNPNSGNILIDNVEKTNLLTFMDWAKNLMPNQSTKDIVDQLKLDLIANSNIPVYQVHTFMTN